MCLLPADLRMRTARAKPPPTERQLRIFLASLAGLVFIIAWVAASMVVADRVFGLNAIIQFVYFAVVGFVWVFPIRWLMLWSVRK